MSLGADPHFQQFVDAVLGCGVGGEEVIRSLTIERVYDHQLPGFGVTLGSLVGDLRRAIGDFGERRGKPLRVTADFRTAFVGFIFARPADRHLDKARGHGGEDHDGD